MANLVRGLLTALIGICSLVINFPLLAASRASNETARLPVDIYYEALCGDSVTFITNQLYPSWSQRHDYMKLRLVPFGKAWIDETGPEPVYHCQHGHRECQLNILHACILNKLPFRNAFPVIGCLMRGLRTSFDKCIKPYEDKKESITKCSEGSVGAKIYKKHANETDSVHRPLPFVPTIVGDKSYDYYTQDDWLYKFDKTFVARYEEKFGVKL